MKFNFEDYKGKYVMWCKTEEEAEWFCRLMHEDGRKWNGNESYLNETNWENCSEGIVYYFNEGEYDLIVDIYMYDEYTILKASDFMSNQDKPFTKSDLKAVMLVETKAMGLCLVIQLANGLNIFNAEKGSNSVFLGDGFSEDLYYLPNQDYNIDTVFESPECICIYDNCLDINVSKLKILYKRNKRKITRQKIRELLGGDFELID